MDDASVTPTPILTKSFCADNPGQARIAASEWLRDFREHGPLNIVKITVEQMPGAFAAVLVYSEERGKRLLL